MDELFEILTLAQTQKARWQNLVIVLYGSEFWKEIYQLRRAGKVWDHLSVEDMDLFEVRRFTRRSVYSA